MAIIPSNKELAPRKEHDFYPTPLSLARAALSTLPEDFNPDFIIDPGAGDGVWGKAALDCWKFSFLLGVEIRETEKPDFYDCWEIKDYGNFSGEFISFDLVMGNPPFKYAHEFLYKSFQVVRDGGYIVFLLPLAFLESKKRYTKFFTTDMKPKKVSVSVRRVSFSRDGRSDDTAYAIYTWQKGWSGDTILEWLDWKDTDE